MKNKKKNNNVKNTVNACETTQQETETLDVLEVNETLKEEVEIKEKTSEETETNISKEESSDEVSDNEISEGKETEEPEKEKTESAFKVLCKLFWVPLSILGATFMLFFGFLGMHLDFTSHFITPSNKEVYGQKEDEYFLVTYVHNDMLTNKLIENVKKASKELNCGWYLVDLDTYPELYKMWQIDKTPNYRYINKNAKEDERLLYVSYGNKHHTALVEENKNIKTLGMPQNDIGKMENIDGVKVTLKNVSKDKDEEFRKVTFEFNNTKDSSITISKDTIKAMYANFKNEHKDYTYKLRGDDFENVTINSGGKKEIDFYYNAKEVDHFQVEFKVTINGSSKSFFYKLWHK